MTRRLVLDDDPTGTQTVAGVPVILAPSPDAFAGWLAGPEPATWVITNTRALPEQDAVVLVRRIRDQATRAAGRAGQPVELLLRGDSTLRGHVFAELDSLAPPEAALLLVPAFPEGGRVTVDGVHYLTQDGVRVPVAETEFARDPVFGYRSRRIVDWVAEVGGGRLATSVPLLQVRAGPAAVREALCRAPAGMVVVPDAETRADLEAVAGGLAEARAYGRTVVVRAASSFASVWAGVPGRPVPPGDPSLRSGGRLLLVCGSHTAASTRQLAAVGRRWRRRPVVLDTGALHGPQPERAVRAAAAVLGRQLDRPGLAVLASERVRRPGYAGLDAGARVMAGLTATVAAVVARVDAVVAKGGATAAQVATGGLGASTAQVVGQLAPGIPLWRLRCRDGRQLPYAVVPGNVGGDDALVTVVRRMATESPRPTRHPRRDAR